MGSSPSSSIKWIYISIGSIISKATICGRNAPSSCQPILNPATLAVKSWSQLAWCCILHTNFTIRVRSDLRQRVLIVASITLATCFILKNAFYAICVVNIPFKPEKSKTLFAIRQFRANTLLATGVTFYAMIFLINFWRGRNRGRPICDPFLQVESIWAISASNIIFDKEVFAIKTPSLRITASTLIITFKLNNIKIWNPKFLIWWHTFCPDCGCQIFLHVLCIEIVDKDLFQVYFIFLNGLI